MTAAELPVRQAAARSFADPLEFQQAVGETIGTSGWLVVAQDRVDAFAGATGDHQWIHVDVDRAGQGPFGTTVAHGYLTLSLLPLLAEEIYEIRASRLGLNYGLEKVRFPAPVLVGSRIRATATLLEATPVELGIRFVIRFVVEIDGVAKPACVADVVYIIAP